MKWIILYTITGSDTEAACSGSREAADSGTGPSPSMGSRWCCERCSHGEHTDSFETVEY